MLGLLRRLISLTLKLSLLAVGIGGIIAYANLSDLQGWKKDLQDRVMKLAGRRIHIDGPIDFKVGLPPRIIAEGIRLENARWGKAKDMLKAKRLVAEVDFLPLMLGDVAVPRLRLEGAEIIVEVAKGGKTNWDDLSSFETASGGTTTPVVPPGGVPGYGSIINSGGISVLGGQVTVRASNGVTTVFNLPNIDLGLGALNPCL